MSPFIRPIMMFQRSPCTKAEPFDFEEYLHDLPEHSEPDMSVGELPTVPAIWWYPAHMVQYDHHWAFWLPGPLDEPGLSTTSPPEYVLMHSRAHQGVDTGSSVEEKKAEEEEERLSPSDTESVVSTPSLYCSVLTRALGLRKPRVRRHRPMWALKM